MPASEKEKRVDDIIEEMVNEVYGYVETDYDEKTVRDILNAAMLAQISDKMIEAEEAFEEVMMDGMPEDLGESEELENVIEAEDDELIETTREIDKKVITESIEDEAPPIPEGF